MTDYEKLRTTQSEEYKAYLGALCRLASTYVPRIRHQFATRAYDKYQDASIRRLVLAYGEEARKLDADRLRVFEFASDHPDFLTEYPDISVETHMGDCCLNQAGKFAAAVYFLFDID